MIHPSRYIVLLVLLASTSPAFCDAADKAMTLAKDPEWSQQDSSWLSQMQHALEDREYFASVSRNGLQAPNRAQGFRSYFDAHGIRLAPRIDEGRTLMTLTLAGVDRVPTDSAIATVAHSDPARVQFDDQQVFLQWDTVQAELENSRSGLATRWTVTEPPSGDGWLNLAWAITEARIEIADHSILLHSPQETLQIEAITARDADDNALQLSLRSMDNQVHLHIDDQHANYPIVISSLLKNSRDHSGTTPQSVHDGFANAQLESDQTDAHFGFSVAGAGDVNGDGYSDVIVGAPDFDNGETGEGAAFLYLGSPVLFDPMADAQLEINQAGARMGHGVAGAGDVNGDGYADVIVGAEQFDSKGAAFIYLGGPGAFNTVADAQLMIDMIAIKFGSSVASAGDVNGDGYADVIVGAPVFSNGEFKEGAAFIYFGGAGQFDVIPDAQLEGQQDNAGMGKSVAGAGDINGDGFADVIVGANGFDNGEENEGAAFVYLGRSGVFDSVPHAQVESNQIGAGMGQSVASAGDVNGDGYSDVIVGAPFYDTAATDGGSAFVYFGGAGAFNTTPDEQLPANQLNAQMGWSVAGVGDVNGDGYADVVSGAPLYFSGQNQEGGAFLHLGGPNGFDNSTDGRLHSNQVGAVLGISVAAAGDVNGDGYADVIVGSNLFDNGQIDEGSAFLYFGSADAISPVASALVQSSQTNAFMGISVAGAGDVNGDGYGDVVVGASGFDNGEADEGVVLVYFGGSGPFDTNADALLEPNQENARFGFQVAGAGDVNGDGYADIIVGAIFHDHGESNEGAAMIYFGGAGAFDTQVDAMLESDQVDAQLGRSVAGAGDINADGYADVIVGTPFFDIGMSETGVAFVYHGGNGAFDTQADVQLSGNQHLAQFGISVASAGDINGDGHADVMVGASLHESDQENEGAVYVYLGRANGLNITADAQLQSNQANALFGVSVASAGDVNGDGFSDMIVGSSRYQNGSVGEGAAYLYFGGPNTINTTADAIVESNQANAGMGNSVAGAGDVNGDGYADVIIGAQQYASPELSEGAAYVYLGGPGAFDTVADVLWESNLQGALLGRSVASAGDVNGDGYADLIVGVPQYSNVEVWEGAFLMYYGVAEGRLVLADQYRGDGSSTGVAQWGLSHQDDGFVVALNATSPRGRERARLQVEACPQGVSFGSLLCTTRTGSTWTDLTADASGTDLILPMTGLNAQLLHHWRARVQYAPLQVATPGITAPGKPLSGPWRRLQAGANPTDIRTGSPPPDLLFADGFE